MNTYYVCSNNNSPFVDITDEEQMEYCQQMADAGDAYFQDISFELTKNETDCDNQPDFFDNEEGENNGTTADDCRDFLEAFNNFYAKNEERENYDGTFYPGTGEAKK